MNGDRFGGSIPLTLLWSIPWQWRRLLTWSHFGRGALPTIYFAPYSSVSALQFLVVLCALIISSWVVQLFRTLLESLSVTLTLWMVCGITAFLLLELDYVLWTLRTTYSQAILLFLRRQTLSPNVTSLLTTPSRFDFFLSWCSLRKSLIL